MRDGIKERKGKRVEDREKGGGEMKGNKEEKGEGWGKQRKKEVKMCQSERKKKKKLTSCIEGEKKKIQQHIKSKSTAQRGKLQRVDSMVTEWWVSGKCLRLENELEKRK